MTDATTPAYLQQVTADHVLDYPYPADVIGPDRPGAAEAAAYREAYSRFRDRRIAHSALITPDRISEAVAKDRQATRDAVKAGEDVPDEAHLAALHAEAKVAYRAAVAALELAEEAFRAMQAALGSGCKEFYAQLKAERVEAEAALSEALAAVAPVLARLDVIDGLSAWVYEVARWETRDTGLWPQRPPLSYVRERDAGVGQTASHLLGALAEYGKPVVYTGELATGYTPPVM